MFGHKKQFYFCAQNKGDLSCGTVQKTETQKIKQSQPQPILVTLELMDKKRQIMSRKKMLAGTSIYINNDLTKEQMSKEKDFPIKRRQLLELAEFKNKVINSTMEGYGLMVALFQKTDSPISQIEM